VQVGLPDPAAAAERLDHLVVALDRADQLLVDASTIVATAALSARTRPVNSAARFSSIVVPPHVWLPLPE
jgi:hypothetical protein